MTDFEMDKTYTITGRELLALLSLIPDGTEKAKAIVKNVAGREKSGKVKESQIDFLMHCPFCGCKMSIVTRKYICIKTQTYSIIHPDNGCILEGFESEEISARGELIDKWNRRVNC